MIAFPSPLFVARLPRIALVFAVGMLAGPAQADEAAPARDRFGDPLPAGALARMGTVRFRHGGSILSVALSPDDRILVTAGGDHTVRLWDMATGKEVCRIQAHKSCVTGVVFLHDGKSLMTGGDSAIRLWDIRSGAEITPDRGHSTRIVSSALSADGRTLITGGHEGGIRWWDLATGKELRRLACLTEPPSEPWGLDLSADGRIVAYQTVKPAGENGEVDIGIEFWDLATRKKRALLCSPNVFGARLSPDGKTLFTHVWDGEQSAGFIHCWDTATGKELRTLAKTPNGSVSISLLSVDGKLLAGAVREREEVIYLWDTATGKEVCRVPTNAGSHGPSYFAISRDNKLLAVADGPYTTLGDRVQNQHIRLWDIATGKEAGQFGYSLRGFGHSSRGYLAVAFSDDGKTLATAGEDNQILLWETATGGERLHLSGHAGPIGKLIFAENDRTLISTSSDTTALVWDVTGTRRPTQAANRQRPSPQEMWSAVADPDAAKAYRAMCRLIAAPVDALALLRQHLKPVESVNERHIQRLIVDLGSDAFVVREKTTKELRQLGELAELACRQALAARPELETRRRLQQVLDEVEQHRWRPTPEILRQLRVVEVLERIGIPEAQRLLETLAKGAEGARLTREARAAVQRVNRFAKR